MLPLLSLLLLQLGLVAFAQKGQTITILRPSSIPQCAITPIIWTGGTPPFTMSTSPTDDSGIDAFEFEQAIETHQSTFDEDWPAGTKFTITVTDNEGNSQTTDPPFIVGPSSNSSCLDPDFLPANSSSSSTTQTDQSTSAKNGSQTGSQSRTASSSHTASPTRSASSNQPLKGPARPGRVVVIGAVIAVVVVVGIVVGLIIFIRRRTRRNRLSGRENFVRAFGNDKAGLDGDGEGRIPSMAIPDPFIYLPTSSSNLDSQSSKVSRKSSNAMRRKPTVSSRASTTTTSHITSPSSPTPNSPPISETSRSLSTNASRKGERYLPDFSGPRSNATPSSSRLPDEDIDRLAARMVELMASGRMTDQSWSPAAKRTQQADLDLDDDEGLPGYNEVTRGARPQTQPVAGPSNSTQ